MNFKHLLLTCSLIYLTNSLFAQCTTEQEKLDDFEKKYTKSFNALEKEADGITKDLPDTAIKSPNGPHISGTITFKRQDFSFNLITVSMKEKRMVLKLPQVTMREKSFSVPYTVTRWKTKKLCCGIKTKIPQVTVKMKRSSFKFADITMKNTEMSTKIPEFRSERKDFSFNVPQFKFDSPIPEDEKFNELRRMSDDVMRRGDSLGKRAATLSNEQKEEGKVLISGLYTCLIDNLTAEKAQLIAMYDANVLEVDKSIEELKKNNVDPASVVADDGIPVNMLQIKQDILTEKGRLIQELDNSIVELKSNLEKVLIDFTESAK